ncbi:3-oxo-5-alpha-steroid 4-dehydrogenase-domain-containing protein [Scleroderma yunnanense]
MHLTYDLIRKGFLSVCPPTFLVCFFIDAPFGRFALSNESIFTLDGVKSWIIMEIPSPIVFCYALIHAPLLESDVPPLSGPQLLLAAFFLLHYANRALISPLRTPSRSRSHISVFFCGMCFNVLNGLMMGTYLRSGIAHAFLSDAFARPLFWGGAFIWLGGFLGNWLHDEVLLNIRRNAKAKGITKSGDGPDKKRGEHYAIPQGYLYKYISYPNYFCEWLEWFGFALAAAPLPPTTSLSAFAQHAQAPWVFIISEVFVMFPRAYKGHQWYHKKFPDYPKERKIIVPFII